MNAADLAQQLDAKKVGGQWMAVCPSHDDHTPSLAITDGRTGVVLHCHGGCPQEAVLAALPVTVRDLFNAPSTTLGREVAVYDYHDETGTLLFQAVRYEPKTFRMRVPDLAGPGGWSYKMNGTRRVLYHLPEVVQAVKDGKRIWVTEGEKDCDAIRDLGHIATTNPNGAGKWRSEYNALFAGADVVVIADRDAPGYEHARHVERQLKPLAKRVVVVESAVGKDISDHFAAGKRLADLVPMATVRVPETPVVPSAEPEDDGFIRVGDLVAEPDNPNPWIIHGLLPSSGVAMIAGKPKAGKSYLARALCLRVARGEPVLGRETMQGPVIYLGLEDPREAIKGHYRRMGATKADDLIVYTKQVPDEAQAWLKAQIARRDPVLVCIDTMGFFLGITDINDYGSMLTALRSILALVREVSRAGIVVIHHAGKGDRIGFDAILGSSAILGTVDTALLVKRREEDKVRTVQSRQRQHAPGGEDMPETVLSLDDHGEPKLSGTKAEYDLTKMGDEIVDYLTKEGEWRPYADVLASVEGNTKLKVGAVQLLIRMGRVERQGEGKKGKPYLFRVPGKTPPEKPFFLSGDTPRKAERNPETRDDVGGDTTNSFLPFPDQGAPEPPPEKCTHPDLIGGMCPTCDRVAFLAAIDAEAKKVKW